MGKVYEEEGVIQVSSGMLTQKFKHGDIFIHVSFSHSQFLELFLCSDVFSIVNKCTFKPSFENLPSILSRRNESGDLIYAIEPVVPLLDPFFDLWSVDQQQKVGAAGHWVACYTSTSVHKHESLKLCKELVCFVPISSEVVRRVPFESSVAFGPFFFFIEISHGKWVISGSLQVAWRVTSSSHIGGKCYCIIAMTRQHFFI